MRDPSVPYFNLSEPKPNIPPMTARTDDINAGATYRAH